MAVSIYWNDGGVPVPFPIPDAEGETNKGTIKTTSLTSVDRGSVLVAGTDFTVPEYSSELNNLQVYVDGLLCVPGESGQYIEVSSTVIRFNFDIQPSSEITALATIGSSYEGKLVQRSLISENRTTDLEVGATFNVPEHQVGYGRLKVYLDGLMLQEQIDYTEVNSSSIAFNFVLPASSQVIVQAAVFM